MANISIKNPTTGEYVTGKFITAPTDASLSFAGLGADAAAVGKRFDTTLDKKTYDPNGIGLDIYQYVYTASGTPRYGVSGVGGAATSLQRLWDAVGMKAMVGTDVENASYQNDFDDAKPFARRKCVGEWSAPNEYGESTFTVHAYYGDPDYTEDGSMGDYVAVEVDPFWYYQDLDKGILGVSAGLVPGWEVHPVCKNKRTGKVREHTYLPCYRMAKNEAGIAVVLPGYHPVHGHYKGLRDVAQTYGNIGANTHLEPMEVRHYEWLMSTIEFATTDHQTIMKGACSMSYAETDVVALDGTDVNFVVTTAAIGGKFTVGQTVYIGTTYNTSPSDVAASYNIVTAIEACDASGAVVSGGEYRKISFSGNARTVTAGTTTISSRPWITGSCNSVLTPSGSPVSNTNGKYPMRYRYRENIWANNYSTSNDLFATLEGKGTEEEPYSIAWHYLQDQDYYPSTTSKPDAEDYATDAFKTLSVTSEHVNGYIKEISIDPDHPECIVPTVMTGATASTYYGDYCYVVNGTVANRSVRWGGSVHGGSFHGPLYCFAYYPVSFDFWSFGGDLYVRQ